MKCKECGYENKQDAKFCQGCGAKLGSETKKAYEPQREYYEPMPMPRKKNTGVIITVISLSVLLVAAIVTIVLILVLGGNKDDNKASNNSNNNEYNYNNNNNNNNNNYNNNNNNTNNSSNTLTCTIHEDEDYGVVTIYLDSYNKVKSATATITFYDIEDAKTLAETLSMLEIDFYRNGSTVTVDDYLELGGEDLVGKSKTNAKSAMQSEGFTCY